MTLAAARGFVIDVDGCLVLSDSPGGVDGGHAIPGAPALLDALRHGGKRVLCCTNGSSQAPARYAAGLRAKGIDVADEEMLTPPVAAARHIARHRPGARVLALGGAGVADVLIAAGIRLVDAQPDVVLVGYAETVTRAELEAACHAVLSGAPFLVTSTAPWFAARGGRGLGMAAAVAGAIERITDHAPTVVGKPSSILMEAAAEALDMRPGDIAIVGDDIVAEVGMGRDHGAFTVLVLSGITSEEAVDRLPAGRQPHLTVADVGELAELLR